MNDLNNQEKWRLFSQGHQGLGSSENIEEFFVNFCKSTVDYVRGYNDYITNLIPPDQDFLDYRKEVSTPAINDLFKDYNAFDSVKKIVNTDAEKQIVYQRYVAVELELRGLLANFGPLQIEAFQMQQLGRFLYFATFHIYVLNYGIINGGNFGISADHVTELLSVLLDRISFYTRRALKKYQAGYKIVSDKFKKNVEALGKFREKCGILIFDHVNHWSFLYVGTTYWRVQYNGLYYDIVRFIDAEKYANPATNMKTSNRNTVEYSSMIPFTDANIQNQDYTQKYYYGTFYLNPNNTMKTQVIDCLLFSGMNNAIFKRDHVYPTHSSFYLQAGGGYIEFDVNVPMGCKDMTFHFGVRYHYFGKENTNSIVISFKQKYEAKIFYTSEPIGIVKCLADESFGYHEYKSTFNMTDIMYCPQQGSVYTCRISASNVYIKSLYLIPADFDVNSDNTCYILPK